MSLFLYFRSFLLCRWACASAPPKTKSQPRASAPAARAAESWRRFCVVRPNQAVSKCEARACVLRPLKCRAENAGLGAQTEKKEEKEFFSTVIRSRRGSSDCSSRDRRPL